MAWVSEKTGIPITGLEEGYVGICRDLQVELGFRISMFLG